MAMLGRRRKTVGFATACRADTRYVSRPATRKKGLHHRFHTMAAMWTTTDLTKLLSTANCSTRRWEEAEALIRWRPVPVRSA